jgi:cytochrome c
MKKVLGTILVGVLFMACGEGKHAAITNTTSDSSSKKTVDEIKSNTVSTTASAVETSTSTTEIKSEVSKADIEKGMTLVGKSDCLTCHKLNEKVIGPSYKEVAKKYANKPSNIKMLAGKIINGGSGVWGAIPMTAHATLSQADAELMVKYIMSLK